MISTAIVPHTGQVLDLPSLTVGEIARLTDELRDYESRSRELKAQLAAEIARRCDANRSWTVEEDGWKVSIKSDALVAEWDVTELQSILFDLVEEGLIALDASRRAVTSKVEWKAVASGVNALMKSPALAERLESARRMVEPTDRRLSIARIG